MYLVIGYVTFENNQQTKKWELSEAIETKRTLYLKDFNKDLPRMIDQNTQLSKSTISNDGYLEYNYVFVGSKKSELNVQEIEQTFEKNIESQDSTTLKKEVKDLQLKWVTAFFKDKNGEFIFSWSVLGH